MKYSDFITETFKEYIPNKKVLEIGGSAGMHREIIVELNPETFYRVDPALEYNTQIDEPDFYGTANDYYRQRNLPEFDVVLCMGLLYHLHSPYHLLEQIVNISKPKILIVESLRNEGIPSSHQGTAPG